MPARTPSRRRIGAAFLLPIALCAHLFGCSGTRRGDGHPPAPAPAPAADTASPGVAEDGVEGRVEVGKEVGVEEGEEEGSEEIRAARREGRALLQTGDWRSAIPFLEEAIRRHPDDPVLHVLLARAGARALAEERCAYDVASVSGIRAALEKAFALGFPRREAAADPALILLRRSLWFQFEVLGRDPHEGEELRRALEESDRLVAVGTAQGAFGAQAGVDFGENGRAVVWRVDSARIPPRMQAKATWSVSPDAKVTVALDGTPPWGGSQRRFEGRMVREDREVFLELPGLGRIGDDDFECSA